MLPDWTPDGTVVVDSRDTHIKVAGSWYRIVALNVAWGVVPTLRPSTPEPTATVVHTPPPVSRNNA